MNEYIYKVRFVALKFLNITITKIMHQHKTTNSSIIISTTNYEEVEIICTFLVEREDHKVESESLGGLYSSFI